jgi:hypothetical protein
MELTARAGLKAANLSFWRCFARTVTRQTTRRNDKCIHAIALTTCQRCIKSSWRVVFMGGRYGHRIRYPDHARNGRPHPLPLSPVQNPILPGFAKGSYQQA